jgi:hypothetical protein
VLDTTVNVTVPNASTDKGSDRDLMRIYNIADLNIVPIKVLALARDVPCSYLMNYSYTTDAVMERFLRKRWAGKAGYDGKRIYPEDVVVELIKNPYCELAISDYYSLLRRAVSGDLAINAGRPKFLGDQLWNKALLNELYSDHSKRDHGMYSSSVDAAANDDPNYFVDVHGPLADAVRERYTGLNTTVFMAAGMADDGKNALTNKNPDVLSFPSTLNGRKVDKVVKLEGYWAATRGAATPEISTTKAYLFTIGRIRFSTTLVRNMMLFTWIQYVTRLMVNDRMHRISSPVIYGTELLDSRFTEYDKDDMYDPQEFS